MKNLLLISLLALSALDAIADFAGPRSRHDLVRAQQSIGRVLIAPDQSLLLYEWLRPAGWARSVGGLADVAAKRPLSWLYQVKLRDVAIPTSEYALMPTGGASYYLGELSPDGKNLSFYRVNYDNSVKAGAVRLSDLYQTIFDAAPDDGRLGDPAVWSGNQAVIYAAKPSNESGNTNQRERSGPRWIVADYSSGKTSDYTGAVLRSASGLPPQPKGLPADTRLLAVSPDNAVQVFEQSNADVLKLYIIRNGNEPEVIFENRRHD